MNHQTTKHPRQRMFQENPYDLETFFESLSIASDHDKELIFIDQFTTSLRTQPKSELADICYKILKDLDILKSTK